jgi:alkylhydroperoxidase/carboxymuconolactone decarboxylase family protein YurZ
MARNGHGGGNGAGEAAAPPLDLVTEAAVTVAALMASGRFDRLAAAARALVRRGVQGADLREAAYLGSLFCGFPRGVAALVALAEVDGHPGPGGVHRDRPAPDRGDARRRGEEVFRAIHQANAGRQLEMLDTVHPDFADTVLTEAYGRVIARDFLPIAARELGGIAALAVLGLGMQLRAHVLGARNVGAPWPAIEAAIRHGCALAGAPPDEALGVLDELHRRSDGGRPG